MSHWTYQGKILEEAPEDMYGFVYMITTPEGLKYIGKKQFFSIRRRKVSGSTRRKVTKSESNWKTYASSSDHLKKMIKASGSEGFKFEVLVLCETKGQLSYAEEYLQFLYHALPDENFLNNAIGSGKFRGVKFTPKFVDNLKNFKGDVC